MSKAIGIVPDHTGATTSDVQIFKVIAVGAIMLKCCIRDVEWASYTIIGCNMEILSNKYRLLVFCVE